MLNLEKHISELLYQYDCVIVPNLGGFVANNISAQFNEKTGIFNPPSREIGFNRSLSHNDGLLINYISKCEKMPYEEVQDLLLKHISILKYQLVKGETLRFATIGNLKADNQGNPYFIAEKENSFATESFGLSTFHFNTLEQEKELNDRSRHLVRKTLQSRSVRQIAASITLVLGLMFISPEIEKTSQFSSFSDMIPQLETTTANTPSITEVVTPVVEPTNVVKEETTLTEPAETKIIPENKYFIIGGSFKYEKPALDFINKLNKRGINSAEILNSNKGRFRVSLEAFSDKDEASEALDKYRRVNGYSSAWLFTKQ
ncbi:SPOR domain-containing protein [Plebeiibacterium sediminum]|uniref:SPOR domain-containing protein n=1 Tax=Plebeiibacterium sediminum TaxID=2992112 RepID=A0AAE3M6Y5_9BACT|nr:SPOR domain-containing protein [Plebeiobacterium sediminum]MCW3788426.1 SPOR domain-containing protein [Plebeiobacterium sediminum]